MAAPIAMRPAVGRLFNTTRNIPLSTPSSHILPVVHAASAPCRPFSSTSERSMRRPRRDGNRLRGLSSLYRSGPRFRMNIDKSQLPQPVRFKGKVDVDPNHGLWEFFYSKEKLLLTPEEDAEHGRAWSVEELRHKSWDDLHKLWWVCVKEQNRIATARKEKGQMKLARGETEIADRLKEVRKTMKSIKHALTERFYLWEDARKLAETDDEINLHNMDQPYQPQGYLEEQEQGQKQGQEQGQEQGQLEATAGEDKAVASETETETEKRSEEILPEEEKPSTSDPETADPSTLPPKAAEAEQPPTRS